MIDLIILGIAGIVFGIFIGVGIGIGIAFFESIKWESKK